MKLGWTAAGVLVSAALTFLLVFIIAVLEFYTGLSEGAAGLCVYAAAALSVFAGAVLCVSKAGSKALPHAMAVAFVYIAAMLIASLAVNGRISTDIHCISIIAGVLLAGFLGAVCAGK